MFNVASLYNHNLPKTNNIRINSKVDNIQSIKNIIAKHARYRKITFLPKENIIPKKEEEKRYSAKIWKFNNIRISLPKDKKLTEIQKETIKEHFIKELSEIVIANKKPFATLSESNIEILMNFFKPIVFEQNKEIKKISLLDYVLQNSEVLRNWLENYYKKKLFRDKVFLGEKEKKKKRRKRRFFKHSFIKKSFRQRRAKAKGWLKIVKKKAYVERLNRIQYRLKRPQRKWTFGFITGNIKRRNAFITVGKKAIRKNKLNKFEVRLSNIYKKTLKNFSIGQLKTFKGRAKSSVIARKHLASKLESFYLHVI